MHHHRLLLPYTGGGAGKKAKLAITHQSETWGICAQHLLDSCLDVRASFLSVEDLQRPHVPCPGSILFCIIDKTKARLTCDESNKIYACRVGENVVVFADEIELQAGPVGVLPAPAETAPPPEPLV